MEKVNEVVENKLRLCKCAIVRPSGTSEDRTKQIDIR